MLILFAEYSGLERRGKIPIPTKVLSIPKAYLNFSLNQI